MNQAIDTGDEVLHRPTGEHWVVAYVRGDRIAWCGWPEGEAALADCELVTKANEGYRRQLLEQLAKADGDARGRYAKARLARSSMQAPPSVLVERAISQSTEAANVAAAGGAGP